MRSLESILAKSSASKSRAAENFGSDKRFAPRRKGSTPALIYFDGTTLSVPCLIRDMSATGARLELRAGWDNPFAVSESALDSIRLVVRMDRVVYNCKIVRRAETELGVKFTAAPKPLAKVVR